MIGHFNPVLSELDYAILEFVGESYPGCVLESAIFERFAKTKGLGARLASLSNWYRPESRPDGGTVLVKADFNYLEKRQEPTSYRITDFGFVFLDDYVYSRDRQAKLRRSELLWRYATVLVGFLAAFGAFGAWRYELRSILGL